MADTPERGSILVRRGPTDDREAFTPLNGEVIYDTTNDQLYVGDGTTSGGKPAFGDKIKVDREGNVTEILLKGEQQRPSAVDGLFRYNPNTQSLEYSDGSDYYLVASSPFITSTNVLYVSPNGKDDNTYGSKRGRTPGTAFASLNAACREAERIINRASKGLGPYQKWITYDSAVEQKRSYIVDISDVDDFKRITVFKGASELDATTELRGGFRVLGMTSGATGIIEEYNVLAGDTKDELIVKVENGEFIADEELKFGNPIPGVPYSEYKAASTEYPEITIRIESGIYFEHYPIKVPNNTSIKGDEFRRSIIRPRPGPSASPYAETRFKRNAEFLGLDPAVVGELPFGAHYLADSDNLIYDYAANPGDYGEAYETLSTPDVKSSLADSVIDFITANYPSLDYDEAKCRRDVGYIIDAAALDMLYGGYKETLNAALTYQGQLPGTQVTETAAAIDHLKVQASALLESAEQSTVEDLIGSVAEVIRGNFNAPKDNDEMDVFLMNDATIIRNITCQGHGGFMEVLDPEGQILTKSPYTQTASSFSRSLAPDVSFAGGMFIDGFCGNLDARIVQANSSIEIVIDNVYREPQTPTSFFINGTRFQIDKADTVGVSEGQYRLLLNPATPWTLAYYQVVNETATSLPSLPYDIEILTAGNISMLGNDFTQINDLGYGIYTTNNARCELVSVFCYYCHVSYLAENGSDIRSLNGSTAYGDYALVARGSDPLEVSDQVFLAEDTVQIATVTTTGDYPNQRGDTVVYIVNPSYAPFNVSELEIDHLGENDVNGDPVYLNRYEVTNVTSVDGTSPQVYALNIAQGAADNPGIQVDIPDGTKIVIRSNQVLKFTGIIDVNPTRPSTALVYDDDPDKVYRVLSYDVAGLAVGEARITLRESYDYVKLVLDDTAGSVAGSGQLGDTKLRLDVDFDENEAGRIQAAITAGNPYVFGFDGTIHQITAYRDKATTGQIWAEVDITPALTKSFADYPDKPTMRAGPQSGQVSRITVGISTLRVTGHDLLDIGTGSYQTSSYPREIYGPPEIPASQPREVVEEGKGRVFYVTTDQDGNFRVGEYFKVDQGTGTVTFSASIALSNLDGIGFKRGVAVSEFSTDDAMTDNASDTVPTESAVRSYVNRRLGLTHNGQIVPAKIGPGYLDLTATQPLEGNLDLANNKIERVADPVSDSDATNKLYVENYADSKTFEVNSKSANVDNSITLVTDDIAEAAEDPTNLYFTDARARAAFSATKTADTDTETYYGNLAYDSSTGIITLTGTALSEVRSSVSAENTSDGNTRYGDLTYTESTGVFTYTGISIDEIRGAFSVTGSITYDEATGQISFSEKTDQDIRGLFSAGGDLAYNSNTGQFSITKFTTANARASFSATNEADTEAEAYYGTLAYNSSNGIFKLTGVTRSEIRGAISVSGDLSYNSSTGVISYSTPSDEDIRGLFSASGDVSYDSATGVFSFTQGDVGAADVRSNVSGNDAGGLGSFTYTENTGVFEYTGPSNSDIRGLFSASGDLSYDDSTGAFSITLPADTGDLTNDEGYIKLTSLSATGDISYDNATGEFSFSETPQRTDNEIRNLFTGGNDLSYNSISGEFSVTTTSVGTAGNEVKGKVTLAVPPGGNVTITHDETDENKILFDSENTTYIFRVGAAPDGEAEAITNTQARIQAYDGSNNQDVVLKVDQVNETDGLDISFNTNTDIITLKHANTSSQQSVDNSASSDTVISDITLDTYGHITAITSKALNIEDLGTLADLGYTGATDADNYGYWTIQFNGNAEDAGNINSGDFLDISGVGATTVTSTEAGIEISSTDTTYSTFTDDTDGLVPNPGEDGSTKFLRQDGTWVVPTNTTYTSSDFDHDSLTGFVANEHIDWTTDQGSTNIHSGNYTNTTYSTFTDDTDGLVPTPGEDGDTKFLRQDGTWVVPTDTNDNTVTEVGISGSETSGTVTIAGGGTVTVTQDGSTVTITGSAAANTTNITAEQDSSAIWYPAFVSGTGDKSVYIDNEATDGLSYVPSTSTLTATNFEGTASKANYADLAEVYKTDQEYPVGTAIMVGGSEEVTAGNNANMCIGVISAEPAYLMNSQADGQAIGLKGRVPVRVSGPVVQGQPVYAWEDGVCTTQATVALVGISLETCELNTERLIECVLKV
jgi:hypothetical protein